MDFIYQPRYELVGIVVLVVVEKCISCSDARNESAVVDDSPVAFGLVNVFEKFT